MQVILEGLDAFAEKVLMFFKARISEFYPEEKGKDTEVDIGTVYWIKPWRKKNKPEIVTVMNNSCIFIDCEAFIKEIGKFIIHI